MCPGQVGGRGTDEGINVVENGGTLSRASAPNGFGEMNFRAGGDGGPGDARRSVDERHLRAVPLTGILDADVRGH
jgi:hypothetical protein